MEEYLEIGKIVNTYGIKGFVKVIPYTDNITRFKKLKTVFIEKKNELIQQTIEEVKYSKNVVLLKFKEISNIETAEKLKNCYIKINRKDAVTLPENSYFIVDLLGLEVYTKEGKLLGKVDDIFPTGSNDVYVVKDEFGKQILLPAIKSLIKEVNIINNKIIVDLIEGL